MLNFFHKLLNPHCADCKEDAAEKKICPSCETLKTELAAERYNNQQMLNSLLRQFEPKPNEPIDTTPKQSLVNHTNWRHRKAILESEDRAKAEVIRKHTAEINEATKSTEQLEKELLGDVNNG